MLEGDFVPLGDLVFKKIEQKWAAEWEKSKIYHFDPSSHKPIYSIDTPPPFTSGALHMGHMLSYSYFDFAARYKRMRGFSVFYPQGWDCQGFPTEVRVEKKFGRLPRDEFKKKCVEFTLENIEAMKGQMRQMGFSPDWKHEYKTMDGDYHRKVQYSLLKMFEKNLVYRKKHPVLFCTNCQSAIAKAETEEVERDSFLNTLQFEVEETGEKLLIATTRPELLHACVAVLIHPDDSRAPKLAGKHAKTPVFGKTVPIISDKEVDKEFGTGAVMACSFGDKEDVRWIYKYGLPEIESWTEYGKILNAGPGFDGLSVNAMRERILEELKSCKKLLKQEKTRQAIKMHDRCGKPVDFLATQQWFVKVKDDGKKIIEAAEKMEWIPGFSLQYLIDWTQFIDFDWVISRQRVYGTPLPFYYCEKCGEIFAPKESELPLDPSKDAFHEKECSCGGKIVGEQSTCDCWIDSSITPLVIAGWPDAGKKDFDKLYPATLRPQGLEIIRTWAFYTIARCLALTGEKPFKQVLVNGSVLGTDGKKMSKSVGNYEDPVLLLKKYSADALRQWAALSGAFARDRPFSYKDVERSQAFLNKLWNAGKFVEKALHGFEGKTNFEEVKEHLREPDKWALSRLSKLVKACTAAMDAYDYYAAINAIHQFFWLEFCDYYLEEVKYRVYGAKEGAGEKGGGTGGGKAGGKDNALNEKDEKVSGESKLAAQFVLREVLEKTLLLLAPFAVFVPEEIHSHLFSKKGGSLHSAEWPAASEEYINPLGENNVAILHFLLSEARKFKASKGLALNEPIAFAKISAPSAEQPNFKLFEQELREVGKIEQFSLEEGEKLGVEFSA